MELNLIEYQPEVFFKLAHHAKGRNLLKLWERSLLYNIGKYLKNEWKISDKMGAHADRIIKETRDCGLWQQVQEELYREEDYGERSLFDTTEKFQDSIKSPFSDEWGPARQYLQKAFKLEDEGTDIEMVKELIDKAREVDAFYTDTCLGRRLIIKQKRSNC